MKTKAFTLVEIMIIVVIIGLLAAMIIPAVGKVRDARLLRIGDENPKALDIEQYSRYVELKQKHGGFKPSRRSEESTPERRITIDGREYKLVPVQ